MNRLPNAVLAALVAAALLLLAGCEGVTGSGDATSSATDNGVKSDSVATGKDTAQQTSPFRYVILRDGFNAQLTNCKKNTPGADIDAVELYPAGDANPAATCGKVTFNSAGMLGRASCGADKDPPAGQASAAEGGPDAGCKDDGCTLWDDSTTYLWLNGGEMVCELSNNERVFAGDTIIVYEVFDGSRGAKTKEEFRIFLSDTADSSGTAFDLGTGRGLAPVKVPSNLF